MGKQILCSWYANEIDWENDVANTEVLYFEDDYTFKDYLYDNIETTIYKIEEVANCVDTFVVSTENDKQYYVFNELDELDEEI